MTEILTQHDIDQLMDFLSSGQALPEEPDARPRQRTVKIYDFKRPEKFSKDQTRLVGLMHEIFARQTASLLTSRLNLPAQVRLTPVDQLSYEEFTRSIPSGSTLAVINMDPLNGAAVLTIDSGLTSCIIDRLFGGSGQETKTDRDLTDFETPVMEGIIVRMLGSLREAWAPLVDVRPRLAQIETNPQFAQIVPPGDMAMLVTLEARIGNVEGLMTLCIPYLTLEPIIAKLSAQILYGSARRGTDPGDVGNVRESLAETEVTVAAELGTQQVTMRDVLGLEVGDVVRLRKAELGGLLTVRVGDREKFYCRPGVLGASRAVQVIRKAEDPRRDVPTELMEEEGA
jgi:flagellar motor switch protein FliM